MVKEQDKQDIKHSHTAHKVFFLRSLFHQEDGGNTFSEMLNVYQTRQHYSPEDSTDLQSMLIPLHRVFQNDLTNHKCLYPKIN
jgi:hypothetical protein